MRKSLILAACMCAVMLSACDNIEIIKNEDSAGMNGSISESETTETQDDWKTAVLTDENGAPIETTLSEDSAVSKAETTSVPATEETTQTAVTETEHVTEAQTVSEETESETNTTIQTDVKSDKTRPQKTDDKEDYPSSFNATVLSAERKYLIVKPDIKSDEFEVSRKIIVYATDVIDYNVGDYIVVKYSGEMGLYEDNMPTIQGSIEMIESAEGVPEIIEKTKRARVEIIRTYSDGLLVQLLEDSGDLAEGDRVTLNVRDGLIFEKGGVLEILYSQEVDKPKNDYPIITVDEYTIESSPEGIIGEIVSINDKGCVISFIKGSVEIEEGTTVIIIDENAKTYKEGDRVKFIFTDNLEEEPYIIYEVVDSFIAE